MKDFIDVIRLKFLFNVYFTSIWINPIPVYLYYENISKCYEYFKPVLVDQVYVVTSNSSICYKSLKCIITKKLILNYTSLVNKLTFWAYRKMVKK